LPIPPPPKRRGLLGKFDENALPNYIIENNFTKVRDMKGRIGLKNIE
jgi:hypothetical protein